MADNLEKEQRKAIRKLLFIFGLGFFLVAAVVVGALSFLVHRTHQYVEELSVYPQDYVLFLQKDSFRPPQDGVISNAVFQKFLEIQDSLEARAEQLAGSGKILTQAKGKATASDIRTVREMELSFFKQRGMSIRLYKWVAFQVLVDFGGEPLHRYRRSSAGVPFARSLKNPGVLLEQIPQENLDLFDRNSRKLLSFRYLWLTAI